MPRSEIPPKEEPSPRQVQLMRSAYRAMGERGVHRVSLQEIADLAGVSKGLILYYFGSKRELVMRTMEWALVSVADRIREGIAGAETPEKKVAGLIDVVFADPEANRNFYLTYIDLLDHAARVDEFGKLSATFRSVVDSLHQEVIRLGVSQGAFRVADVGEAATTMRAIIDGLFLQWIQEERWRRLHASYRETCKRAVLAYLRAPDPRRRG